MKKENWDNGIDVSEVALSVEIDATME